jgi:hypothetical protein
MKPPSLPSHSSRYARIVPGTLPLSGKKRPWLESPRRFWSLRTHRGGSAVIGRRRQCRTLVRGIATWRYARSGNQTVDPGAPRRAPLPTGQAQYSGKYSNIP